MKYKLIIIWEGGEREEATYQEEQKANEAEEGYHKAFGTQILWTCVIPTRGE
jgi:hypothetical protein